MALEIPRKISVPNQGDTSRYDEEFDMGNMPEGLENAMHDDEDPTLDMRTFKEQLVDGLTAEQKADQRRHNALTAAHNHVKALMEEKGNESYNRNQERYKADLTARVTEELRIARYLLGQEHGDY